MSHTETFFECLDSEKLKQHITKQRYKAKALRRTQWWQNLLQQGICYYCKKPSPSNKLTMDHIVPLARGGTSSKNNIVPSCFTCNQNKKLEIPAEVLINGLRESVDKELDKN